MMGDDGAARRASASDVLMTTPSSDRVRSAQTAGVTPSRLRCFSELQGELTCGICLDICQEPCTTPCGHNFCKQCIGAAFRLMSRKECPKCRAALSESDADLRVNSGLWNVIQLLFPRLEMRSPQWKHIKTPQQRRSVVDVPQPVDGQSPGTHHAVVAARMMLEAGASDPGDLDGEGPILHAENLMHVPRHHAPTSRGVPTRNVAPPSPFSTDPSDARALPGRDEEAEPATGPGDGAGDGRLGVSEDGGAVAGFTTARELMERAHTLTTNQVVAIALGAGD